MNIVSLGNEAFVESNQSPSNFMSGTGNQVRDENYGKRTFIADKIANMNMKNRTKIRNPSLKVGGNDKPQTLNDLPNNDRSNRMSANINNQYKQLGYSNKFVDINNKNTILSYDNLNNIEMQKVLRKNSALSKDHGYNKDSENKKSFKIKQSNEPSYQERLKTGIINITRNRNNIIYNETNSDYGNLA